jgi:putative SOS response-associated peptidase YedK
MCGRYAIISAPEALRGLFAYDDVPSFPPRYNIAPTQPVPIVRSEAGRRRFRLVRWGLIPPWVKDPRTFSLLVNARSESVLEKPAFRAAVRRRRCLFPADGFFQWKLEGGVNTPYWVRRVDGGLLALAGIWETWIGPNGEELETAAIVTTAANRKLAALHERMPVVIRPDAFAPWLDSTNEKPASFMPLIEPAAVDLLEAYPVSPAVNDVGNDAPELVIRVTDSVHRNGSKRRGGKTDPRQPCLFP